MAAMLAAGALLAGCGGDEGPARADGRPLVAALGDSITAGTPSGTSWTATAQRRLPRVRFRTCGVNGERTDEIAARLGDCARGARSLVVQGGINDLAQGVGPAVAAGHLRDLVREGRRRGLRVAIVEVLPWNNGHPITVRPIDELNRRIAAIARAEGARLIRWYGVLEDPARPDRMRPDLVAPDGDHPSQEGYRLLGEAFELP